MEARRVLAARVLVGVVFLRGTESVYPRENFELLRAKTRTQDMDPCPSDNREGSKFYKCTLDGKVDFTTDGEDIAAAGKTHQSCSVNAIQPVHYRFVKFEGTDFKGEFPCCALMTKACLPGDPPGQLCSDDIPGLTTKVLISPSMVCVQKKCAPLYFLVWLAWLQMEPFALQHGLVAQAQSTQDPEWDACELDSMGCSFTALNVQGGSTSNYQFAFVDFDAEHQKYPSRAKEMRPDPDFPWVANSQDFLDNFVISPDDIEDKDNEKRLTINFKYPTGGPGNSARNFMDATIWELENLKLNTDSGDLVLEGIEGFAKSADDGQPGLWQALPGLRVLNLKNAFLPAAETLLLGDNSISNPLDDNGNASLSVKFSNRLLHLDISNNRFEGELICDEDCSARILVLEAQRNMFSSVVFDLENGTTLSGADTVGISNNIITGDVAVYLDMLKDVTYALLSHNLWDCPILLDHLDNTSNWIDRPEHLCHVGVTFDVLDYPDVVELDKNIQGEAHFQVLLQMNALLPSQGVNPLTVSLDDGTSVPVDGQCQASNLDERPRGPLYGETLPRDDVTASSLGAGCNGNGCSWCPFWRCSLNLGQDTYVVNVTTDSGWQQNLTQAQAKLVLSMVALGPTHYTISIHTCSVQNVLFYDLHTFDMSSTKKDYSNPCDDERRLVSVERTVTVYTRPEIQQLGPARALADGLPVNLSIWMTHAYSQLYIPPDVNGNQSLCRLYFSTHRDEYIDGQLSRPAGSEYAQEEWVCELVAPNGFDPTPPSGFVEFSFYGGADWLSVTDTLSLHHFYFVGPLKTLQPMLYMATPDDPRASGVRAEFRVIAAKQTPLKFSLALYDAKDNHLDDLQPLATLVHLYRWTSGLLISGTLEVQAIAGQAHFDDIVLDSPETGNHTFYLRTSNVMGEMVEGVVEVFVQAGPPVRMELVEPLELYSSEMRPVSTQSLNVPKLELYDALNNSATDLADSLVDVYTVSSDSPICSSAVFESSPANCPFQQYPVDPDGSVVVANLLVQGDSLSAYSLVFRYRDTDAGVADVLVGMQVADCPPFVQDKTVITSLCVEKEPGVPCAGNTTVVLGHHTTLVMSGVGFTPETVLKISMNSDDTIEHDIMEVLKQDYVHMCRMYAHIIIQPLQGQGHRTTVSGNPRHSFQQASSSSQELSFPPGMLHVFQTEGNPNKNCQGLGCHITLFGGPHALAGEFSKSTVPADVDITLPTLYTWVQDENGHAMYESELALEAYADRLLRSVNIALDGDFPMTPLPSLGGLPSLSTCPAAFLAPASIFRLSNVSQPISAGKAVFDSALNMQRPVKGEYQLQLLDVMPLGLPGPKLETGEVFFRVIAGKPICAELWGADDKQFQITYFSAKPLIGEAEPNVKIFDAAGNHLTRDDIEGALMDPGTHSAVIRLVPSRNYPFDSFSKVTAARTEMPLQDGRFVFKSLQLQGMHGVHYYLNISFNGAFFNTVPALLWPIQAQPCGHKQLALAGQRFCLPCPNGAVCDGTHRLASQPGYWFDGQCEAASGVDYSGQPCQPEFYECPNTATSCLGGPDAACAKGYSGPLCLQCSPGFFQDRFDCLECPATWQLVLQFLGFATIWMGAAVLLILPRLTSSVMPRSVMVLKVLVLHVQAVSLLRLLYLESGVAPREDYHCPEPPEGWNAENSTSFAEAAACVPYRSPYLRFMQFFDVFAFFAGQDPTGWLPVRCLFPWWTAHVALTFWAVAPVAFAVIAAAITGGYLARQVNPRYIKKRVKRANGIDPVVVYLCSFCKANYGTELCETCLLPYCNHCMTRTHKMSQHLSRHPSVPLVRPYHMRDQAFLPIWLGVFSVLVFLMWPQVVSGVMNLLKCKDYGDVGLVWFDTSLACSSGLRLASATLSVLYGLCAPIAIVGLLWWNRPRLCYSNAMTASGIFYWNWSNRLFWWEAVVFAQRLCVLAVVYFTFSGFLHVILNLLLAVATLCALFWLVPAQMVMARHLEHGSVLCILVSLCILGSYDDSTIWETGPRTFNIVLFYFVNIATLLVFGLVLVREMWLAHRSKQRMLSEADFLRQPQSCYVAASLESSVQAEQQMSIGDLVGTWFNQFTAPLSLIQSRRYRKILWLKFHEYGNATGLHAHDDTDPGAIPFAASGAQEADAALHTSGEHVSDVDFGLCASADIQQTTASPPALHSRGTPLMPLDAFGAASVPEASSAFLPVEEELFGKFPHANDLAPDGLDSLLAPFESESLKGT
eukprot:gene11236-303_t